MFGNPDDYDYWVKKFFEGSFLVPGWNLISKDLLDAVPADERPAVAARMDRLGQTISREWAKRNEVRRISSNQLKVWGDALKKAKPQGLDSLRSELAVIEAEVDQILAGSPGQEHP